MDINSCHLFRFSRVIAYGCLVLACCVSQADDDDDKPRGSKPSSGHNAPTDLSLAAIETSTVQTTHQAVEISSHGSVQDLTPLLEIRQQYLATLAQQSGAQAKYRESELNLHRTRKLHDQDIVASRRLQEQQALWQADQAELHASSYRLQAIVAASRLQWGERLTDWFTQSSDFEIKPYLQHRRQLLTVVLPHGVTARKPPQRVWVDDHGNRPQAVAAELIAVAPQVDPLSLGQRAFYRLEQRQLPIGAQLTAWISDDESSIDTVAIPESALVWHLGQPWVFIKDSHGEFKRQLLTTFSPIGNGLLSTTALSNGQIIVRSGAQTLLSQELKHQIPDEDD